MGGNSEWDHGAASGFLHGDTQKNIGGFDGYIIVGDENELSLFVKFAHHLNEPLDIPSIEGSVNFIKDHEGARLHFEEAEQECEGGHGSFSTGQEFEPLLLFARDGNGDFNTRIEDVEGVGEANAGFTSAEELHENVAECGLEFFECFDKALSSEVVEFFDSGTDFDHAFFDICDLGCEFVMTFGESFVCVNGTEVDVAHLLEIAA